MDMAHESRSDVETITSDVAGLRITGIGAQYTGRSYDDFYHERITKDCVAPILTARGFSQADACEIAGSVEFDNKEFYMHGPIVVKGATVAYAYALIEDVECVFKDHCPQQAFVCERHPIDAYNQAMRHLATSRNAYLVRGSHYQYKVYIFGSWMRLMCLTRNPNGVLGADECHSVSNYVRALIEGAHSLAKRI